MTVTEAQQNLEAKRAFVSVQTVKPKVVKSASVCLEDWQRRHGTISDIAVIPNPVADARERESKVKALREKWDAPKRQLQHLKHGRIDRAGQWEEKRKLIESKIGTGFLIGLIGGRGRGKTELSVSSMITATERQMSAQFATATDFFLDLKATFKGEDKKSERDVIEDYRRPRLLVLDEVGKKGESDWEQRLFFQLVNLRHEDMKDTILISNDNEEQFAVCIGPSLMSRMQETGGLILCDWESYRGRE